MRGAKTDQEEKRAAARPSADRIRGPLASAFGLLFPVPYSLFPRATPASSGTCESNCRFGGTWEGQVEPFG